jgi:hypothetical protein
MRLMDRKLNALYLALKINSCEVVVTERGRLKLLWRPPNARTVAKGKRHSGLPRV